MTRTERIDFERDMPVVNLRSAILDALEAHERGVRFDPEFLESCRDQLTAIYEDTRERETA